MELTGRAPQPGLPPPPLPLVLLLLVTSLVDIGCCQLRINQDRSTCRMTPTGWNASVQVGTRISATCDRACTEQAVERNRKGQLTLRGTDVYSLDSDLCLAAIHDARLAYPSHWRSDASSVQLRVVLHRGLFVGSFRRGIRPEEKPASTAVKEQPGLVFVSSKANETIPEVVVVYNNFRYEENDKTSSTVECHVPVRLDLSESMFFRPTGVDYSRGLIKPYTTDDRGKFNQISVRSGTTPLCSVRDTLYSDTKAFGFIESPYYQPEKLVYRASLGDRLEVRFKNTVGDRRAPAWFKDGSEIDYLMKIKRTDSLIFESINLTDAGLYQLQNHAGRREGLSVLAVIVRGCPANRFGAGCQGWCPYCLHGGQCHEVTGQCVCPPGFHGDRCQKSCERGRFGANCSSACSGADCRNKLLCVPEPYGCGCASGYKDTSCYGACDRGSYGPDCVASCGRCREGPATCDRFTGNCTGGCEGDFSPPLCLDLPPWFRDPPQLDHVGYTTLRISHRSWRDDYDNGYGTGPYNYTVEYRRRAGTARWRRGPTERHRQAGTVTLELKGLRAETAYSVRIVIGDEGRGTATTDDSKVPAIPATTDCQKPGKIIGLDVPTIRMRSAVVSIEPLLNQNEACFYSLKWTLSPAPTRQTEEAQPKRNGRTPVQLRKLSPYTNYTFRVFAENRKGRNVESAVRFTTKEAPPSAVTALKVGSLRPRLESKSDMLYLVTWKRPQRPNGVIRRYTVVVTHQQYRACRRRQEKEEHGKPLNVKGEYAEILVRHPFSNYSVSVTAVTVSPGPSETRDFVTEPQAPSAGLSNQRVSRVDESTASFSWTLPACTTWNDDSNTLRIELIVTGTSLWNNNTPYGNASHISLTRLELTNLTPYSNYTAKLSLHNSVGSSPPTEEIQFSTHQRRDGPARPANLTVLTVSSTSLTVGWDPPSPPYCRITQYRIRCQGPTCSRSDPPIIAESRHCRPGGTAGLQCSALVPDLSEVTSYTIQVAAFCPDISKEGLGSNVEGKTQEGKPGPPKDVRQEGLELTQLNVSWTSPVRRNGIIRQYHLVISEPPNSWTRPHVIEAGSGDNPEKRYSQLVPGLESGRSYLVRVAASTAAGRGNYTEVTLQTRVPPPQLTAAPEVRHDLITDSTVQLRLPSAASAGGPPVSRYYVIVSKDPDLDGGEVEQYDAKDLPNAEEARRRGISFYVAAVGDPEHVDGNGTFVIGDGKYYNTSDKLYYNQPLDTGETYRIGMAALSKLSDNNQALKFKAVEELITVRAPNATGVIVGILFAVMLFLLIVIVGVVCRRRWKARSVKSDTPHQETTTPDPLALQPMSPAEEMYDPGPEDTYANLTTVFLNKTRIPLSELPAATRNTELLRSQISSMPSGLVRPCNYGRHVKNREKNRYGNLMPYDDTRVKLEKLQDDEFSDYINASYVDGYERPGAYIATQGPKPQTIFDFWRMVWEKRAARIVMLTNLVEGDKKKCDLYWPDDKPLQLLSLTVRKESERMSNDYTIRTFSLVRDGERKTVTHLHYTVWPDHSVPLYPSSLARFIRELDAVPDAGGPTVVHCSAGVGRTGTVILIDAMHKMGRQEQAVDVYRQLTVIRRQRANLCASLAQYQLVHQVLIELLVAPSTAVPAAQLAARLPQLKSVADGPSELEQQLSYLASNPPPATFASARAEQLEGKNRSPEILPEDKSRVFIHGHHRDNYINAVYVQGFKKPDAFIATEAPLPARRSLFWHMVVQKQSQTIVVMNDLAPEDVFWPTTEERVVYGSIAAQLKNRISEPVETLDVTLNVFTNGQMESSQEVRLFLLPLGRAPDGLPSASDLVTLHAAYERSMPDSYGGVTTVVCRGGVTGCGLFITCSFLMDQLAEEQEVDVVMAVATVRKSRPQFVGTLKQLELCYDVALAWLKAFDIYANFQ